MLIDYQLPISKDHLLNQDRTLSFAGMTWNDYEKFNGVEYLGYRTSFLDGVITVMSPSRNHEAIKDFIFLLVVTYCDSLDIDYYPTGSTTLKNQSRQVGKGAAQARVPRDTAPHIGERRDAELIL